MADNKDNDAVQPGISDPLSKRDTDTGSLDRLDDTRTRKTIKLRPVASGQSPAKLAEAAPVAGKAEEVTDPLNTRHTNTGSFAKLDDTRTRKTIKMAPAGMKGEGDPEAKTIEIAVSSSVGEGDPEAKTIELSPADVETATVPVAKAAPAKGLPSLVPGVEAPKPKAPIPMPPKPIPVPAAAPKPVSSEQPSTTSGKVDSMQDTRTRKTIKITPAPTPRPTVLDATESVMPSVAPAKAISPAEKTIKLRPSEGGSAPPAPVAPQSSAKDTIKLKPGASAPPMAKPPTPVPALAPASGTASPSAATVNLKPASQAAKPGAPTMPLKPAAPTLKPAAPPTTSSAPPPAAPPSGAPKLGVKAPTAPPTADASAAPEGEKKKGGLSVKKDERAAAPAGPPRAQKEQEELKGSKKKGGGDNAPSLFYTIAGAFTLILILFSAFVSAAQYINLWEQERFEERVHITVPFLEDHINMK